MPSNACRDFAVSAKASKRGDRVSTSSKLVGAVPEADTELSARVTARFGLVPNFFQTAGDAPGLIDELWKFAQSAYLDNPLPSLFKERLFVHLSRFCEDHGRHRLRQPM
jgi:hypothetical protein